MDLIHILRCEQIALIRADHAESDDREQFRDLADHYASRLRNMREDLGVPQYD
ncbi:hypothetical protein [Altericroceibacterium endophyticum]|uniref:Uncharacterized protein n=1 Tax=Altericroceibacterium endophyticum TaxID=1808508 RepID=A0A6I4T653_9SPHN|nr:hypothetical protein [Altericroceibacterium endophyticum]MXO65400.1 hypothetical protein [Altericroceibacterium endophyticum]